MHTTQRIPTSFRTFLFGCVVASFGQGCAPNLIWVQPGLDRSAAGQQLAACRLQAEQSFYSSEEDSEARSSRLSRWTDLCMKANGWRQEEQ
jgi:hypothetical protein